MDPDAAFARVKRLRETLEEEEKQKVVERIKKRIANPEVLFCAIFVRDDERKFLRELVDKWNESPSKYKYECCQGFHFDHHGNGFLEFRDTGGVERFGCDPLHPDVARATIMHVLDEKEKEKKRKEAEDEARFEKMSEYDLVAFKQKCEEATKSCRPPSMVCNDILVLHHSLPGIAPGAIERMKEIVESYNKEGAEHRYESKVTFSEFSSGQWFEVTLEENK